jgi:hypothetical protein
VKKATAVNVTIKVEGVARTESRLQVMAAEMAAMATMNEVAAEPVVEKGAMHAVVEMPKRVREDDPSPVMTVGVNRGSSPCGC